jgi:diguanylate cyclase (GGDEF)-like protein
MSWFVLDYNVRSLGIIGHAWDALARFIFFAVFIFGVSAYKRERTFAREDHLTKVANSQYLAELAGLEIERCRRYRHPFSIVYMDVDDFKTVNDTLGHQAGDALLSTVAQTIRKNVRKSDVVARLGGDEFAILLPETDSEQASSSVSKLQKILLDTMREGAWPCTFSFGLATFSRAPATFDEMISRADRLMYEAKSGGKNTVRSGLY